MKKNLFAAVAMAGVLVLSACGSDEVGQATAPVATGAAGGGSSEPEAGTSVSTMAPDPMATPSEAMPTDSMPTDGMPTGDPTDSMPTDSLPTDEVSTPAADLEESTVAWMSSFCTGFVGLGGSFAALDDADVTEDPAAYATLQTTAGTEMSDLGAALAMLPPPGLTDGDNLAMTFVSLFTEQGPKLVASGTVLAAAVDDAAAADAAATVTDEVDAAIGDGLDSLTDLTDAEEEAISQIPECGMLSGDSESASAGSAPSTN